MPAEHVPHHLSPNHRDTLLQIFQHPTSHNIEWHSVLSLLSAVGEVEERKDGKVHVAVGGETRVLTRPKHKDVDVDLVVEVRKMLAAAGYQEMAKEMGDRGKEV